ncbi:hypothetical protein CK247_31190, partial [Klebsiella pneumoniae]
LSVKMQDPQFAGKPKSACRRASARRSSPGVVKDRCAYVLSVKMQDPQFAGKPKSACRRASARRSSPGVVK